MLMNRTFLTKTLLIASIAILLFSAGIHSYALAGGQVPGSYSSASRTSSVTEEPGVTVMAFRTSDDRYVIDALYPKIRNLIINSEIEMLIDETIYRFKSLYDEGVLRITYKPYSYADFILSFEFDIYESSGEAERLSKVIRNYDLIGERQIGLSELFNADSDYLEFISREAEAHVAALNPDIPAELFTAPREANFRAFALDGSFLHLLLDLESYPGITKAQRYTTVRIPVSELNSCLIDRQQLRSSFEELAKTSGDIEYQTVGAFSLNNSYNWENPDYDGAPFIIPDDQLPVETPKFIALTFDDGPLRKTTTRLLDALKERQIRATFFILGYRMETATDLIRRMVDEGHAVGNHTYNHKLLNTLNRADLEYQLRETNKLISEAGGIECNLLRPPFGARNAVTADIAKEEGMSLILWDVDPKDWESKDALLIAQHIINRAKDGDIILLHDIYETSVDAAIMAIDELTARGFVFLTVDELINMYSELEVGEIYRTGKGKEKAR